MIRYEIYDKNNPTERGQRFKSRERAEKELKHAVPQSRFDIRTIGKES